MFLLFVSTNTSSRKEPFEDVNITESSKRVKDIRKVMQCNEGGIIYQMSVREGVL